MASGASERMKVDLVVHPIKELVTPVATTEPLHGAEMANVVRIPDAALAVASGNFVCVGEAEKVLAEVDASQARTVSAAGKLVIPGLVDPHTHLVFAGNRAGEFLMRCQGHSYQEIAKAGGGIVASMRATREASVEKLTELGLSRLKKMLAFGTTTCEVKTGYGLSAASELAMLEAVLKLKEMQPVEIVPTFMPAHAFPPDLDHKSYVSSIIKDMLPKARDLVSRSKVPHVFQDVFCDDGYFNLEQTREILAAGIDLGFKAKVHADEFASLGATGLAAELGAASADHLLSTTDADMEVLASSDTVGVLLPGTSFFLNLREHARARAMLDRGMAIALGSDFNPGSCHIFSLPFIWGLACLHLGLSCAEALTALTVNAAFAVGLGDRVGQIACGRQADFLVLDVGSLEEVPYNLGSNPVELVFKKGVQVHANA